MRVLFCQSQISYEQQTKKKVKISTFNNAEVLTALDRRKYTVEVISSEKNLKVLILQDEVNSSIYLPFPVEYYKKLGTENIIDFFINCSRVIKVDFADCFFESKSEYLYDNYYETYSRTFLCPGLSWLNFFGPEEELRQGGSIIEQNPYATRVERFPEGLFMQVGHGPEDCLTPEGEELLLNATKALPPAKWTLDN